MGFENINIIGSTWITCGERKILDVEEPHALIMAAGYLKHNSPEGVYFRGQAEIFEELRPALYRGVETLGGRDNREKRLSAKVREYRNACQGIKKLGVHVAEPLLQHYGLKTTWLDIVDNIWVALWFACHEAKATKDGCFLHFQKRIPSEKDKHAFIYLIGADLDRRSRERPGYWNGENTELIDLRIAAPSYFLRPHAQHGLLFRCKGGDSGRPLNYARQIRGIVRIPLEKAFNWLGDGHTVCTHSLFPPAYYDNGFKILLQCGVPHEHPDVGVGAIHSVGA